MRREWVMPATCGALVFVVAFGLFLGTVRHGFVMDDHHLTDYTAGVVADRGVAGLLTSEFRVERSLGYYRPLVLLSFWADSRWGGPPGRAHHLHNVLLHAVNSALVFFLLLLLTGSPVASLLASLLFAAHPVHVESVAFVSGRTDLHAALFLLISALLWFLECRAPGRRSGPLFVLSLLSLAGAFLSKEVSLMLPPVLAGWAILGGGPAREAVPGFRPRWRHWVAGWALVLAATLLLRLTVAEVTAVGAAGEVTAAGAVRSALTVTPLVLLKAFSLLAVPWPLKAIYAPEQLGADLPTAAGAVLYAVLTAAAFVRGGRALGWMSVLWTLFFLLPASHLFPISAAVFAERFLYIPSVGTAVVVAGILAGTAREPLSRKAAGAAAAAFVAFSLLALARSQVWGDERRLYADIVRTTPGHWHGYLGLANLSVKEGRPDEAEIYYRRAVEKGPEAHKTHYSLATFLTRSGRHGESIAHYREALRLNPRLEEAHVNLGVSLLAIGDLPGAVEHLTSAIALDPEDALARFNLGLALGRAGNLPGAAERYREAIELDPGYAEAYFHLGLTQSRMGASTRAVESYLGAVRVRPDFKEAYFNLGLLYVERADRTGAAAVHEKLASLDPGLAATYAQAAARMGRPVGPAPDRPVLP